MFAETQLHGKDISGFYGTVVADDFSILFEFIYMSVAILTVFVSHHYIEENEMNFGEYYVLLLTSVSGMMFMTSALDLLVIFIGLEIMSISSYILVGMKRKVAKANEAALKYLLLGAFSTGFLLYGISLLYGATGSTLLPTIIAEIQQNGSGNPLVIVGMALVIIAMSFKIAIVPFHMWTPDVYTGAPTPVTGFLSGAAKAAGFAVFIRVLMTGIPLDGANWEDLLWLLAVLTMTVGNIMALQQNEVKRMLAYSSIAHAGYVLVAIVVGSTSAISGASNSCGKKRRRPVPSVVVPSGNTSTVCPSFRRSAISSALRPDSPLPRLMNRVPMARARVPINGQSPTSALDRKYR